MTLAVSLLGEEVKTNYFLKMSVIYIVASTISGALFGLFISFMIYWLSAPLIIMGKILLISSIVIVYIIRELGLLSVPIPQRKWQIPINWVRFSPVVNMVIWGFILGAGIFTYTPFVSFFVMYMYIGLFHPPFTGLYIGFVYGISRALPSIFLAGIINKNHEKQSAMIRLIWSKGNYFRYAHIGILVMLLIYIMTWVFLELL